MRRLEELPSRYVYHFDLNGCDVITKDGKSIGSVEHVEERRCSSAGRDGREAQYLIPLLSICIDIDIERKKITIDPPEGLLEL